MTLKLLFRSDSNSGDDSQSGWDEGEPKVDGEEAHDGSWAWSGGWSCVSASAVRFLLSDVTHFLLYSHDQAEEDMDPVSGIHTPPYEVVEKDSDDDDDDEDDLAFLI